MLCYCLAHFRAQCGKNDCQTEAVRIGREIARGREGGGGGRGGGAFKRQVRCLDKGGIRRASMKKSRV